MARVEEYKILRLWKPPNEGICTQIGPRLAEMLPVEKDVLVLRWAAVAAESFVAVPEVFKAVSALIVNLAADLDVWHNCSTAMELLGRWDQVDTWLEVLATTYSSA